MAQPSTVAHMAKHSRPTIVTKHLGVRHGEPHRLGLILVGDELNSAALKVFILGMNRVQQSFEYEFLPQWIADELLIELAKSTPINRETTRGIAKAFPGRFKIALSKVIAHYKIVDTQLPNYFIVVSMARFTDNFYNLREPGISVIALGNWKRSMSPPSIFEFIQTLIVREAVSSVCPALRKSIHLGSKACICDFNQELSDVRLKVLNGFVCSYCRRALDGAGQKSLADEVERVLDRSWIGDLSSTTSVASILSKLGVNLFLTKGLVPTWSERFLSAIREDGVTELIKLIFAVVLAGLLIHLGWKT